MNRINKLKLLHEDYGVGYSYIAKQLDITRQNLYKALVDEDNKNYKDLTDEQKNNLDKILEKYKI